MAQDVAVDVAEAVAAGVVAGVVGCAGLPTPCLGLRDGLAVRIAVFGATGGDTGLDERALVVTDERDLLWCYPGGLELVGENLTYRLRAGAPVSERPSPVPPWTK